MAMHWTEFPERVEKFGDLFSIYETLDQDEPFGFECFPDHAPNGAYSVDRRGRKWVVTPHPHQVPGLERLLEVLEREGHYSLSRDLMHDLRRRIMVGRSIDRAAVNAMTFHAIADALNDAPQKADPVPQPAGAISQNCGLQTFGDLLASVQCVEQAAAALCAEADSMNGAPGAGHLRIQAGIYEADAEYKHHQAFPALEGYTNAHYGPATYANLVRVRGALCQARGCGTTEADRSPLDEVVRILGCPGAAPPSAHQNPNPAPSDILQAVEYTLNDIRDLLRYRRTSAEFLARLQSMTPAANLEPALGISAAVTLTNWSAFNCPQPPRMTEDEAASQPVYHWLVRSARADNANLDEEMLRLLVGRVAIPTKRTIQYLMALPLEEFDRVRCSIPDENNMRLERPVSTPIEENPPGVHSPVNPQHPGVASDLSSVSWNLATLFIQSVDLAEALDSTNDRASAAGILDRRLYQFRLALNPSGWPFRFRFQVGTDGRMLPGWLESIEFTAHLCADTKRVLESLALIACDIEGAIDALPDESEEPEDDRYIRSFSTARRRVRHARSIIGPSAAALWVVMNQEERESVGNHVRGKACRLFGWSDMPTDLPVRLPRYHDGGRMFDDGGEARNYSLWRSFNAQALTDEFDVPNAVVTNIPDALPAKPTVGLEVPPARKGSGGRRRYEQSKQLGPRASARINAYRLVRAVILKNGGGGAKSLIEHFRGNNDFSELLKTAGVFSDRGSKVKFFRAALAWIKDNPCQDTQSENVS